MLIDASALSSLTVDADRVATATAHLARVLTLVAVNAVFVLVALAIAPGITPGSGPAHLALFGYDPLVYAVGRGALSAAGVGVKVNPGDVAARGNFCTVDADGKITDRRAGRIGNEISIPIIEKLKKVQIPGVTVEVNLVKEYRFSIVMRGEGLHPALKDTDPHPLQPNFDS